MSVDIPSFNHAQLENSEHFFGYEKDVDGKEATNEKDKAVSH